MQWWANDFLQPVSACQPWHAKLIHCFPLCTGVVFTSCLPACFTGGGSLLHFFESSAPWLAVN